MRAAITSPRLLVALAPAVAWTLRGAGALLLVGAASFASAQEAAVDPAAIGSIAAPTVAPVLPAPALVAAPPPAPRRLRVLVAAGYDYGLHDLLTVQYEGGGKGRLGANGGVTLAAGLGWALDPQLAWELRATAGLKYSQVSGANGDAYYLAFPVELLGGWNLTPLRLAAGATLSLGPRVNGSGFLAGADVRLRTSLGLVGEIAWVVPLRGSGPSFSIGLRYLWQKLEASTGGNAIDANALGLAVGLSL